MLNTRRLIPALSTITLLLALAVPAQAATGRTITADPRAAETPGGADDNRCSLIEAVTEAQTPGTFSGGTTGLLNECRVSGSGTPVTIRLTGGKTYTLTAVDHGVAGDASALPAITTAITIVGGRNTIITNVGTDPTTVRFFDVANGGNLTLKSIDFEGRSATTGEPDDGGAVIVRAGGAATLDNVIFDHNTARNRGAVLANFGTTTVTNRSTFRYNQSIGGTGIGGVFYNAGLMDIGGEADIRNNHSDSDGTGVYNDTAGTLTLDDETQLYGNHINTNGSKGAGLYNAGTATVDGAIISKNKGETNTVHIAGGGIYNAAGGVLSVTNTIFVFNQDNGVEAAADLTAFTNNCLYDGNGTTGGIGFKSDTGTQNVDGNWWGIASGPSTIPLATTPLLSATGDAPSGTVNDQPSFLKDPSAGCTITTLTKNPSMEPSRPGRTSAPSWGRVKLGKADMLDCVGAFEDSCAFKITGTGVDKMLTQSIHLKGPDEYYFGLMVSSKADSVPSGAAYKALVTIYYNQDKTSNTYEIHFSPGTHGWEHGAAYFASTINSTHDQFSGLKVVLEYNGASGTVWFDDVRLIYCPYP